MKKNQRNAIKKPLSKGAKSSVKIRALKPSKNATKYEDILLNTNVGMSKHFYEG